MEQKKRKNKRNHKRYDWERLMEPYKKYHDEPWEVTFYGLLRKYKKKEIAKMTGVSSGAISHLSFKYDRESRTSCYRSDTAPYAKNVRRLKESAIRELTDKYSAMGFPQKTIEKELATKDGSELIGLRIMGVVWD